MADNVEMKSISLQTSPSPFSPSSVRSKVSLSNEAGLPAKIAIIVDQQLPPVQSARVFFNIDERFLSARLRPLPLAGTFVGKFPSPSKKLSYRVQLTFSDKTVFSSAEVKVETDCSSALFNNYSEKLDPTSQKYLILKELFNLENKESLLTYIKSKARETIK